MFRLPLLFVLAAPCAVSAPATAAADPHTLGNPDVVRPAHVSLDLTLDFARKVVHGTAELTLDYRRRDAATQVDLDSRGLRVRQVSDEDGHALAFELGPEEPQLGRRLRVTLGARRPAKLRIAYETGPGATALQWLEPRQTTSGKLPFLFTQSQAIHARSWIPLVDSPGARVTYDATVRVPPGMTAVMSAEHAAHEPDKGVFRFRMPLSIPPYLIALAAGEIAFRPLGPRTGVYAEPAVVERAAAEFAHMEKMLSGAEELLGPYAWGRWDAIVLPPGFPFGGMENPRLTFATPTLIAGDRSLVSVMTHELAHSWSGNLATNATWGDFWLNEGFTTYLEGRIDEALYGREWAAMQQLLSERELRAGVERLMSKNPDATRLAVDLRGRDPEDGPGLAYEKGAAFLRVLEARFGRPRFDAFLRAWFERHAFAAVTSALLVEALKSELFKGDEAAWRALQVEEWIFGTGLPPNLVVPKSDRFAAVRRAAETFVATGALDGVGVRDAEAWVTAEWLDFLGALPRELPAERLGALDARFALSRSGNAEILSAWLGLCARSEYAAAYPAIESFLTRQGRMKFILPLYGTLHAQPSTRELARRIFEQAKPGYHPIAAEAVEKTLSRPPQPR
jgi:aminopeptidase N